MLALAAQHKRLWRRPVVSESILGWPRVIADTKMMR
jgi:hypothetical protein